MVEIYLRSLSFISIHHYGTAAKRELGGADIQNEVHWVFDLNRWSFESRACHVNLGPAAQHLEWRVAKVGHRPQPFPTECARWRWPAGSPDLQSWTLTWKPRGWSYDFVPRKRRRADNCDGSGRSMLHAESSASPAMHLQMDPSFLSPPTLLKPTVSHHVLEVQHCNSQTWGTSATLWIDHLKSHFQGLQCQFFLGNPTLPGTDWRPAAEKCQIPTLSATFGPASNPTLLATATPFPQVAVALWVQAPTSWKNLDASQWYFSNFCHCCHWRTRFLTDWTWYSFLRSIRRCHKYPHRSWGWSLAQQAWSPAQRAPTGWLSKRVEWLSSHSTAARSIVPRGIGRSLYETWQEFVSRRNDCSRWNRTLWKKAKNTLFLHVHGRSKTTFAFFVQ